MSDLKIIVKDLYLTIKSKKILSSISMSFYSGYTYLIYGRNGAGKSSLINCVLNFEKYFQGELLFIKDGKKIRSEELKKTYLPEEIDMPGQIRIKDYINSFKELLKDEQRFNETLFCDLYDKFEISSYTAKEFGKLSKGMKKLILIVLTLSSESDIIILDEPLEGLDLISKENLIEALVHEAKKGKIVIVSSHEIATLYNRFDKMISLREGSLTKELNKGEKVDYQDLLELI